MEGFLGALPLAKRFSHLRCRFQLHLQNMSERNPLRNIMDRAEPFDFLARFRSDALFTEFSEEPREGDWKRALDIFLLLKRRGYIEGMKQVLLRNISPSSRTPGLMDRVFTAPAPLQLNFVLWRKGSLFLNRTCVCGGSWKRDHVACMPAVDLSDEEEGLFVHDRAGLPENFNRLDWLLNKGEWRLAAETMEKWGRSMSERSSD